MTESTKHSNFFSRNKVENLKEEKKGTGGGSILVWKKEREGKRWKGQLSLFFSVILVSHQLESEEKKRKKAIWKLTEKRGKKRGNACRNFFIITGREGGEKGKGKNYKSPGSPNHNKRKEKERDRGRVSSAISLTLSPHVDHRKGGRKDYRGAAQRPKKKKKDGVGDEWTNACLSSLRSSPKGRGKREREKSRSRKKRKGRREDRS